MEEKDLNEILKEQLDSLEDIVYEDHETINRLNTDPSKIFYNSIYSMHDDMEDLLEQAVLVNTHLYSSILKELYRNKFVIVDLSKINNRPIPNKKIFIGKFLNIRAEYLASSSIYSGESKNIKYFIYGTANEIQLSGFDMAKTEFIVFDDLESAELFVELD